MRFGDYVSIEQMRYGVENEYYGYKVIGTLRSNKYASVPVESPATEHISMGNVCDVVQCVLCGIGETEVLNFRKSDVILCEGVIPYDFKCRTD